jgi:chromosome segregation protein
LKTEIQQIDALAGTAQGRYAEAERRRQIEQHAWETAEAAHGEARVSLASARAKLEALEQAASGLADPEARRLVEAADGALGSIAARLDVPEHLAAAVDAALGPWVDAVAFAEGRSLEDAVGSLKGTGRGGVPVVAADSSGSGSATPTRDAASAAGLDLLIDALGPDADVALAHTLLRNVVIAEGWAAGRRFATQHPALVVVTPEGDYISAAGVRVAHPDGATPAMLEAAAAAVEASEVGLARASSLLHQARRRFDESRETERDALETLEGLEAQLAGATETLGRLDRSMVSIAQECERLEDRRRAVSETLDGRIGQRARLVERMSALEGEEAERQRAWEELTRRRQAVASDKERERAAWQESSSVLRGIVERRKMIESRRDAVADALVTDEKSPVDPDSITRLEDIERAARQALDAIKAHLDVLRERQAELRARAGATGTRLGEVQNRHDEVTRALSEAHDRRNRLAIESAELRVRTESVAEALRRTLDASEDEALAAPRPPQLGDDTDLRNELERREAELRRMGPVNPLAGREYAELEERHSFMTDQLADLERSREELRKVVKALDDEIQQRFLGAFEEVATAYETHFGILFPGGKGRLRLTDPEDPLASGVEIEAQPLGKKVAKMSLLSGGERSLAALAFLFAVFEARPSPFYILDEVEAALDDANLRRFLKLLGAFRGDAQLMVITHQQQTMETADVLYGVTMEPGGSSKVVAKTLSHAAVEPSFSG